MSTWNNIRFEFAPLKPLKAPLQSALTVLHVIESILEALLDIIRNFLIDFTNPLKAIIALLLAAVRAIINQIQSSGFAMLLVHPDFSRQDFNSVIQSVSGGYQAFETKVLTKFHDPSDIFRPTYPAGSSVAMAVLYVGAISPGDLLRQLFALLQLIRHPVVLSGLPAPVEVTVKPVFKSSSAEAKTISIGSKIVAAKKFSDLFSSNLDKKLVVQWRMPSTPTAARGPSFVNSLTSFVNSFRFPNFVVERSTSPTGVPVQITINTPSNGAVVSSLFAKYDLPSIDNKINLREYTNDIYRHFETKFPISAETGLLEGQLTGTYVYVDEDPNLNPGSSYYYRVRAYFGEPVDYLNATTPDDISNNSDMIKLDGNLARIFYGQNVVMGAPSSVQRGFCPLPAGGPADFSVNADVYDAVRAGILLNFELPTPQRGDTPTQIDQKAGWGSLAVVGGEVGPLKLAYTTSDELVASPAFSFIARRVANRVASNSYTKPDILKLMGAQWDAGVSGSVRKVLKAAGITSSDPTSQSLSPLAPSQISWTWPGVAGGINSISNRKIDTYLDLESVYSVQHDLEGPYPLQPFTIDEENVNVNATDRAALSTFLQLCLTSSSMSGVSYMGWYSVTIGDLFPALIPFLFDFEQFIKSLMSALDSLVKEIEAIIEALITKIQQLEQILQTIINLINLLDINVNVSVLLYISTNGSSTSLAQALAASTNKPDSSPFGLHSGLVMTAGGPGEGSIAAIRALGFLLGIG